MIKNCLNCNRTDAQAPLITLTFKDQSYYICPQCLPNLIHHPEVLGDKLPGIEILPSTGDEH